ncbi:fasciclin domain-containing protein [Patescibacteria group bacterium]|nr:fasciclin domain-containing protein [Patescibacteria group bacterium]
MNREDSADLESVTIPEQERAIEEPEEAMQNIVEIAVSDPRFSTLVTALTEADLVETLSGEGPFTVFAPTDEAFAKIPEETLNEILADKDQLTSILTYHVVAGKVMAADVVTLTSAETVQGGEVTIEVTGNEVMMNNAKVLITDIEATNGVIHVIDTVLIPQ